MLSFVMLNVIVPIVVILNVVAPQKVPKKLCRIVKATGISN
jgi:hypothetical protein